MKLLVFLIVAIVVVIIFCFACVSALRAHRARARERTAQTTRRWLTHAPVLQRLLLSPPLSLPRSSRAAATAWTRRRRWDEAARGRDWVAVAARRPRSAVNGVQWACGSARVGARPQARFSKEVEKSRGDMRNSVRAQRALRARTAAAAAAASHAARRRPIRAVLCVTARAHTCIQTNSSIRTHTRASLSGGDLLCCTGPDANMRSHVDWTSARRASSSQTQHNSETRQRQVECV
jgi:hypothetical protein